jgi:Domain of unknown function (DUF4907)
MKSLLPKLATRNVRFSRFNLLFCGKSPFVFALCLLAFACVRFFNFDAITAAAIAAPSPATEMPSTIYLVTPANAAALPPEKADTAKSPKQFTAQIIPQPDGTWGYDILSEGKLLIHQPHIPALPGNRGFETTAQAERVAAAVIQKMEQGERMPTLSVAEVQTFRAH